MLANGIRNQRILHHTTSTPVSVSLTPQLLRKMNRTNETIGNTNKIHHWQDGEVWSGRLLLANNWDILMQVKIMHIIHY